MKQKLSDRMGYGIVYYILSTELFLSRHGLNLTLVFFVCIALLVLFFMGRP